MSETSPLPDPDPAARKEVLRLAMKAFRKRMKLMKLDDESRLGHGPMSGGGRSGVVAITPPNQFPKDVWEELVEQGKLRRAGRGIYELIDPLQTHSWEKSLYVLVLVLRTCGRKMWVEKCLAKARIEIFRPTFFDRLGVSK